MVVRHSAVVVYYNAENEAKTVEGDLKQKQNSNLTSKKHQKHEY